MNELEELDAQLPRAAEVVDLPTCRIYCRY